MDNSFVMRNIEIIIEGPWTNIVLYSKTIKWKCFIVVDWIIMANGITASLNYKTVYVAASVEKRIPVSIIHWLLCAVFLYHI